MWTVEQKKLAEQIAKVIREIKDHLETKGLLLFNSYIAKQMGISEQTFYNITEQTFLPRPEILQRRLKAAKTLHERWVKRGLIF